MNAGSYVIIPNSSDVTLIWRRSVALIVPSWTGTSYCAPVRLSVIVSVSAMRRIRLLRQRLGGNGVVPREPAPQVGHLAALAAERRPPRVYRPLPAVDAQRVLGGAQNPFIVFGNVEIGECGNLPRFPHSQISTSPNPQFYWA